MTRASLYDGPFDSKVGWSAAGMGYVVFTENGKIIAIDGGYGDDAERYAFFCKAVIEMLGVIGYYPDILHANDWQTALIPVFKKALYGDTFNNIKSVFTIHNIEYQGVYSMDTFTELFGFSENIRNFVEFNGALNLMKGAIEMTDVLSTVSPSYANEIKHSFFAHGLENIIIKNEQKLCGILNGIDIDYYNPETDPYVFKNYSVSDMSGKAVCKEELQKMIRQEKKSIEKEKAFKKEKTDSDESVFLLLFLLKI